MELIDTSVWAQKRNPQVRDWFTTTLVNNELAICDVVALEVLAGATTRDLYQATREDLQGVYWFRMDHREWERVLQVYDLLDASGTQTRRSVKLPDLLIAACAERHELTLVHYDHDYDTIGGVTGQSVRWVVPRGTL
jgi:predicted nucleic acid-binding protein